MTPDSRRALRLSLLAAAALAASPAFAQSTGVGADLGSFIENIIAMLNSGVVRGLAVLAVIITGIVWMFGQIDLRRAGTVVIGIIVIFGATTIVDIITGGSGG